ncbi:MAG: ATP-binding protein [Bacteroidia bacterium]|nr:ATP-binding protein [Bacteroidia bacterium]
MLLEFSIENYRSFRDRQTLSLLAGDDPAHPASGLLQGPESMQILPSAIIYGANASGKSNLLRAFQGLRNWLAVHSDLGPDQLIPAAEPFKFQTDLRAQASSFEVYFLAAQTRYRYLLRVSPETVEYEALFFYPQGREARLFERHGSSYEFGDYLKGQKSAIASLTAPNQSYLSKAARNNFQQLLPVYRFFSVGLMPVSFLDSYMDQAYLSKITAELAKSTAQDPFADTFKRLLRSFDTGITDFSITQQPLRQEHEVVMYHPLYHPDGTLAGTAGHPLGEESAGTQKLFVLGALMLRALMQGRTILVDEFERSLHPLISAYLIRLFHSPRINTRQAQLILATHDSHLLSEEGFRRDQIWMTEKDLQGASSLFALSDISGIRTSAPLEKWYLSGRLGAIPGIEQINFELSYPHEAR